jgi:hypothetical protein
MKQAINFRLDDVVLKYVGRANRCIVCPPLADKNGAQ